MRIGWKTRVGLVLSVVWIGVIYLVADEYHRASQVFGFGVLPLIILWGICWAIAGFRAQRPTIPEASETVDLEEKQKRRHRVRTIVSVVVVLVLGICIANWQFHIASNESGGDVARWFGEWSVYGLFAYIVLRFVPRTPRGFSPILAAIVVVLGVNYKTYAAIDLDRQARVSLTKAIPLINKLQSGAQVSDQEVKDAQVGMMESLMLAQAAFTRDVIEISATYNKTTSSLQPELMLTPRSLASPNIRAQTRLKQKLWQQAIVDYKSQLDAAIARGKLGIQAQSQMPAAAADSASKGFDQSSSQLRAYINGLVNSEGEASGAITTILDLMDANAGGYVVDNGPPANLLFRDETTLARYRQLMNTVMAISQRESEAQARLVKSQTDLTNNLTNLLKR